MTSFSPNTPVSPVSIHLPMLHNHLHVDVQEQCFRLEINSGSISNLEKKDTKVNGIFISYKCTLKIALKGFFRCKERLEANVRENVIYS